MWSDFTAICVLKIPFRHTDLKLWKYQHLIIIYDPGQFSRLWRKYFLWFEFHQLCRQARIFVFEKGLIESGVWGWRLLFWFMPSVVNVALRTSHIHRVRTPKNYSTNGQATTDRIFRDICLPSLQIYRTAYMLESMIFLWQDDNRFIFNYFVLRNFKLPMHVAYKS